LKILNCRSEAGRTGDGDELGVEVMNAESSSSLELSTLS
jgi:hypothetical protein